MTTQPDIDAIARAAAKECRERDEGFKGIIASAIQRALEPLEQENKGLVKAMALKLKLERHLSEAISERDAAVNGMLDLKRTNQMLVEQLQKHAKALAVLSVIEWFRGYCTCCGHPRRIGHDKDCILAKAIGK